MQKQSIPRAVRVEVSPELKDRIAEITKMTWNSSMYAYSYLQQGG